ncbi:MAG: methyltransferase [Solirubrobacterales bacterium]|nr:methyltransferase [Solirubrobacterales bacterium]
MVAIARIGLIPERAVELVGAALNLIPTPVPQALFAPPVARVLHVGVAIGLFAHLARGGPRTTEELARELELQPAGTRLLCDCLIAMGHLRARRDGRVALSRRSRRWLDPDSPRSVARYVEHTGTYWPWWEQLESLVRDGTHVELHDAGADDASWATYIRGQHELARLSAPEVARALELPPGARSVLDLGGAHGWFSAVLCDRHPGLRATVVDLPGSVAVGREILRESGHATRVDHVEGSVFEAELGEGHDLALVFNLVHHLTPEQTVTLLRRVHAALRPGGRVAVLDLFAREPGQRPGGESFLGLFFHLTSGADLPRESELRAQLAETGFKAPTSRGITRLPAQTLYVAERS